MTRLTPYAFCALSAMALPAAAPPVSEAPDTCAIRLSHARGVDEVARRVLTRAVQASPTVVRLIAELDDSDLIVTVRTGQLRKGVNGLAEIVAATPRVRYVRVVLGLPSATSRLIEVLGHELRRPKRLHGRGRANLQHHARQAAGRSPLTDSLRPQRPGTSAIRFT